MECFKWSWISILYFTVLFILRAASVSGVEVSGPRNPNLMASSDSDKDKITGCKDTESREKLTSCIMKNLDNWAWNLVKIKKSLSNLDCDIHNTLMRCINESECSLRDAVRISAATTDLLTYNKHSGTILHSFLALDYACSPEGNEVLQKYSACLQKEHEGFYMLQSVDEVNDRYLEAKKTKNTQELCALLKSKADLEIEHAKRACESDDVSILVCKTMTHAFIEIDSEIFGSEECGELCHIVPSTIIPTTDAPHTIQPGELNLVHASSSSSFLLTVLSFMLFTNTLFYF